VSTATFVGGNDIHPFTGRAQRYYHRGRRNGRYGRKPGPELIIGQRRDPFGAAQELCRPCGLHADQSGPIEKTNQVAEIRTNPYGRLTTISFWCQAGDDIDAAQRQLTFVLGDNAECESFETQAPNFGGPRLLQVEIYDTSRNGGDDIIRTGTATAGSDLAWCSCDMNSRQICRPTTTGPAGRDSI